MQHNTVLSSKDNVNIKHYQKLAASKRERYADGLFVLEGVRLVQDALLEQAQLECLMVTESALEKYPAFLAQADLREVRLLVISNELGAKIAQTEQPQGVFALCRMPRQEDYQPVLYRGGHFLMLHQLQDPGNLGMILRTADALFCEVNPIPVKQALSIEGFSIGLPRLPLTPLSATHLPALEQALSAAPEP